MRIYTHICLKERLKDTQNGICGYLQLVVGMMIRHGLLRIPSVKHLLSFQFLNQVNILLALKIKTLKQLEFPYWSSNSILGYIAKIMESRVSTHVHSSIIHRSQEVEAT